MQQSFAVLAQGEQPSIVLRAGTSCPPIPPPPPLPNAASRRPVAHISALPPPPPPPPPPPTRHVLQSRSPKLPPPSSAPPPPLPQPLRTQPQGTSGVGRTAALPPPTSNVSLNVHQSSAAEAMRDHSAAEAPHSAAGMRAEPFSRDTVSAKLASRADDTQREEEVFLQGEDVGNAEVQSRDSLDPIEGAAGRSEDNHQPCVALFVTKLKVRRGTVQFLSAT